MTGSARAAAPLCPNLAAPQRKVASSAGLSLLVCLQGPNCRSKRPCWWCWVKYADKQDVKVLLPLLRESRRPLQVSYNQRTIVVQGYAAMLDNEKGRDLANKKQDEPTISATRAEISHSL